MRGHAACSGCHRGKVHALADPPACGSCHGTERATAPAGHQQCTTCHAPHDGARLPAAECASCHTTQAAHRHGGGRLECASCHRPHGPRGRASPPQCTTCHTQRNLGALHAIDAHGTCTSCHRAGETRSARALLVVPHEHAVPRADGADLQRLPSVPLESRTAKRCGWISNGTVAAARRADEEYPKVFRGGATPQTLPSRSRGATRFSGSAL